MLVDIIITAHVHRPLDSLERFPSYAGQSPPLNTKHLCSSPFRPFLIRILQVYGWLSLCIQAQILICQLLVILPFRHIQMYGSSVLWALDIEVHSEMSRSLPVNLDRMG